MKEKKTKNHKENWIGNIIRGFLLFMPLLAIGVTCAYAIFNKNAYQSYYGEEINEVNAENNLNEIKTNNNYSFEITNNPTSQTNSSYIYVNGVSNITNINTSTFFYSNKDNITAISIYYNPNLQSYSLRYLINNDSTTYYITIYAGNTLSNFKFDFEPTANYEVTNIDLKQYVYKLTYNENSFVSEVFYYSIDKVQQSPLFNWSTDTGMYNIINSACNTLEIETTFVPFLLSYWLLTYLIYIIYDIALLIVNIAHNRIHDVESSI